MSKEERIELENEIMEHLEAISEAIAKKNLPLDLVPMCVDTKNNYKRVGLSIDGSIVLSYVKWADGSELRDGININVE
jgi:hypothetical protein